MSHVPIMHLSEEMRLVEKRVYGTDTKQLDRTDEAANDHCISGI